MLPADTAIGSPRAMPQTSARRLLMFLRSLNGLLPEVASELLIGVELLAVEPLVGGAVAGESRIIL